jgi:hypothetical protein
VKKTLRNNFTDFLLASHNNSLSAMTYGFNAAMNPKLDPEKARWAGVIINVHYQPFLAARFPGSQWSWISEGGSETDGGLTVGLIPLNDQDRPVFRAWLKAHDVFHRLNVEWVEILNRKDLYQQAEDNLVNYETQMAADPFLESCFDEWKSQYHYSNSFEKNIEALQRAVRKGYPAAHLYGFQTKEVFIHTFLTFIILMNILFLAIFLVHSIYAHSFD